MKHYIGLLFVFISILFFDQISKLGITYLNISLDFGMFEIRRIVNTGISFSIMSDVSPYIRIVFLTTAYGVIFITSFFSLFLIPRSLITFRYGIIIWLAGISGNVIDRIIYAGAIDFFSIMKQWYFNFADIFQIIGFGIVIYSLFKYEKQLWFPNSLRSRFSIKTKEQLVLVVKVFVTSLTLSLTLAVFCYTYFYYGLKIGNLKEVYLFMSSFMLIGLIFSCILSVFFLIFSQRIVGPVIAFDRYINNLLKGELKDFSLREGDLHQELVKTAKQIQEHIYEEREN